MRLYSMKNKITDQLLSEKLKNIESNTRLNCLMTKETFTQTEDI